MVCSISKLAEAKLTGLQRPKVQRYVVSSMSDPILREIPGDEHDPILNPGGVPSLCVLPLFHPPAGPEDEPPLGHISHDGHVYNCKNPAVMRRSFHM